ncbi:MAG: IclR family transcriptional regulator [Octadecabacter sp.]
MNTHDATSIPTSLRLLAVIEEVARAGLPITPTTANKHLGLPKPTIHRLFATLEEEGFLQRDIDGRSYAPGARLRSLSAGVLSSLRIRAARQTILRKLSVEIGETCNIAIPDRDAMIYLERVETEWPLRIQLPQGTRVPFHCTASGKMYLSALDQRQLHGYVGSATLEKRTPNSITDPEKLLAEVEKVQEQGYALDREEFMQDMIALAVAIRDPNNRLMATVSFHAPTQRFDPEKALDFLDALRSAATDLSKLTNDPSD